jgi:predicted lipoprotein with Yx(FWY)xxD motif
MRTSTRLSIPACLTVLALTVLTVCATAYAQTAPAMPGTTAKGKALVDGKGMTLYIFDRDVAGKSNCTGPCSGTWPPLMAAADAKASGDWSIVARDDGSKQWAYKTKPLYTFNKDAKPGDAAGDGVNSVWHLATP